MGVEIFGHDRSSGLGVQKKASEILLQGEAKYSLATCPQSHSTVPI